MASPLDTEAISADLGRVRGLLRILGAGLAAQPVRWASEVSGAIERRGWTAEDEHAFKEPVRRHPATLSKLLPIDFDADQDADQATDQDADGAEPESEMPSPSTEVSQPPGDG